MSHIGKPVKHPWETSIDSDAAINLPKNTCKWGWGLARNDQILFHPMAAPNRFYRFMQCICLGIIWTKKKG